LDELSILRKSHDASVGAVSVGDKDVTIGPGYDAGRRTKMFFIVSRHSGLAESHQNSSIRTELPNDVSCFDSRLCCGCDSVLARCIRRPYISFAIHVKAVRPDEHLRAEALDDVSLRVEFEDRVVRFEFAVGKHAIDSETAAARDRQRARLVTSDERPDAFAVGVDVHRCGRSHFSSAGKPGPLTARYGRTGAVCEPLHRTVGIVYGAL